MRPLVIWIALASSASAAEKLVLVAGGESAGLKEPFGMDFLPDGSVLVAEYSGFKVSLVDKDGKVTVYAGSGQKGYADGAAEKAQFNGTHNLVVAKDGSVYVADTFNNRVRKIDGKTRQVTTVAGNGKAGFSGDGGPAIEATFKGAFHVALDRQQENLYVADLGNFRIRKIDLKTGIISTVAGNGMKGIPENGANAMEAPLVDPRSCALDSKGRLYILERGGNALRVVEDGKIRTLIARRTITSVDGSKLNTDGAKMDILSGPKLSWVDKNDDVLIADTEHHVIRKYIAKEATAEVIAGNQRKGSNGLDGRPDEAELARPHGVAEALDGTIWIADSDNHRLLKIVK